MILTKFHNFDVRNKILEGRRKSKTCYKKLFSEFMRGLFSFLPLSSQKVFTKYLLLLLREENFFFKYGEWGIKKYIRNQYGKLDFFGYPIRPMN